MCELVAHKDDYAQVAGCSISPMSGSHWQGSVQTQNRQRYSRLADAVERGLPARCQVSAASPVVLAVMSACALGFSPGAHAGSTFTVNTTGDPGPGGTVSLRQAITSANGSALNTVQFDASLVGSTITLAGTEILITKPMYIKGPGRDKLTISGNNASRIFNMQGCNSVDQVKLSGVTLTSGASTDYGGAVRAQGCGLYVFSSRITASNSQKGGGAIFANSGYGLNLEYATINGSGAPKGGAIYAFGLVTISESSILANTAGFKGGGIYIPDGNLTVIRSTISGNSVTSALGPGSYVGGGVDLGHAKSSWSNSTVYNNYASDAGGGIVFDDAYSGNNASVATSTIAGNSSCCYDAGNGIKANGGQPTISSSIVANNFNRGGMYDLDGSFIVNSSLVRNPGSATITGSGSMFGVDPKLGPLKDNGGSTWTMLPAANSPAVDAGAACSGASVDQRGVNRCVNGHVDLGAVERQNPEDLIFRDNFDPRP